MANFDTDSLLVYQAYRPAIAEFAVKNQRFGGEFSFNRMSWIKPNFLWMMYRCGWASKEDQEHVLAIRMKRDFFEEILGLAIPSTYDPLRHPSREAWQQAITNSEVRLQWDPDHDPFGRPLSRRAIQLGLRGSVLRRYGEQAVISIEDISDFVRQQSAMRGEDCAGLMIPVEHAYMPKSIAAKNVGIDT
ncbi:MAG: DUF4291 domain-containing protein [Arenimonas sp.]